MKKSSIVLWGVAVLFLIVSFSFLPEKQIGEFFTGMVIACVLAVVGIYLQRKYKAAIQKEEKVKAELAKIAVQKEAEAETQRQAEEAQKREFEEKHGKLLIPVAGVTFKNDDGSNRQQILKSIYQESEGMIEGCSLEQYEYKGSPAIKISVEYDCIGNVRKEDVEKVLEIWERIEYVGVYVEPFENEENKKVYRADLSIQYLK